MKSSNRKPYFVGILLALAVVPVSCQWPKNELSDGAQINVGLERQLLFDDTLIESKRGFKTTMNPAIRTDEPVLEPEKRWEKYGCHSPSVLVRDGKYHMWYGATGEDRVPRLCYATSDDGVRWVRPTLGLHEYKGTKDTNIVCPHDGGARFRYMDPRPATWHYNGVSGAHSPDGVHWTECSRNPIMPWYTDTRNVAFWDDRIGKYVAYVRWNDHFRIEDGVVKGSFDYRSIGRAESDDFENFPEPEKIMEPDLDNPEDTDLLGGGLYDSAAIKYPFAADSYFIFTAAYHHTSDTLDIQLAASRDGSNFRRWHEPFVRLGREGTFDSKMLYMGSGLLPMGDELWLYYGGVDQLHDQSDPEAYRGAIGRVKIRRDGFVSQDAPAEGGVLTTVPFVLVGNRLEVNMDASARGSLRVEILDEAGRVVPGFSREDADRLERNDLRKVVTWKGSSALSTLRGKTMRLRFIGEAVKLYAFQFVE